MVANLGNVVLALALSATSGPAGNEKAAAAGATTTAQPPAAELGEMVTDRPDFTASTEVVGRGIAQLETGTSYESEGTGASMTRGLAAPQALLRIGLSAKSELRLGADGFLSERAGLGSSAVRTSGGSDFEVAAKFKLATAEQIGFDLSVIPIVSLPVGSAAFTSGGVDPTVKVAIGRGLPAGFDMSYNVNVSSLTDGDARFTQAAWSASFGHDLVKGWGAYWEVYGFSALERGGSAAWTFNTGVSHPIGPNRQVDFTLGHGLTEAASDWFVSAGFSVRGRMRRQ